MSNNIFVTNEQLLEIQTILAVHPGAYVHGSRVKGNHTVFSDLDLCFMREQPVTDFELSIIRDKFENSNLPFQVDICDYFQLNSDFQTIINAHKIKFPYKKIPLLDDNQLTTLSWLFIRHGEPDKTYLDDFSKSLSLHGIQMIKENINNYHLNNYEAIISSSAKRALQTAEVLASNSHLPIYQANTLYLPLHPDDRLCVTELIKQYSTLEQIILNDTYGSWWRYVIASLQQSCEIINKYKLKKIIVVAHGQLINHLGYLIDQTNTQLLIKKFDYGEHFALGHFDNYN